jgi:asparagine synthase (glutamine-hydrolysing)
MCGFIGRIVEQPGGGAGTLTDALPYLRRRGPDSCSLWRSPDGRVELMHTRLAIVDSDARATQPLEDAERGVVVAFNGEIYNYPELRRELSAYPFRTTSDTEVILAAYALHGRAGLDRLRGMYSLVIVDTRQRRVLVVRDPVGKKPLFVGRWGSAVVFGSSVLALLAAAGVRGRIRADAVEYFWRETFVRPDQCIVQGGAPLRPGTVVEFDWEGRELARHAHAPAPALTYAGEGFSEASAQVERLLRVAVERRLRDNPQPAVLCSGGIDSTVVTKLAGQIARDGSLTAPLQVMTLGAAVPFTNDEFYARYATRRLGMHLTVVQPRSDQIAQRLRDCLVQQDEPLGMLSFFPLTQLVATVAGMSRVLLTGDGGDEVFLGYGDANKWQGGDASDVGHVRSGPRSPAWMSAWGVSMQTDHLVGHGFAKVDRASAEQAVEVRCPLLDYDLVAYARSLPADILLRGGVMKALLKHYLADWPEWFLERRKVGFVMNVRWLWAVGNYNGMRECILPEAQEQFRQWLPALLAKPPQNWSRRDIFRHFTEAWRLLVWSEFLRRLHAVGR